MTERRGLAWLWLLPLWFLALFYAWPLAAIFARSLAEASPAILWQALVAPGTLRVLGFTVGQAVLSTLLTLAVGLPGAWLVAHYDFPGKALFRAMSAVPFVLPTVVVAAAFNALLGPSGWLNGALLAVGLPPLQLMNTLGIILLAHVFYEATIVIRLVSDYWANLDPRLYEAARTLGAAPWRAFVKVTLPLLMPALLTATALVFIFVFTSFGVVLLLGGPGFATLEVAIYRETLSFFDLPTAATLSLLQLGLTLGLAVAYTRMSEASSQPLRVRPRGLQLRPLRRGWERALAAAIVGGALVLLLAPLVALATRSVMTGSGFGLDYYLALFDNPRQSFFFASPVETLGRSLGYAAIAVAIALGLGLPTAWALVQRVPGHRLLEPLLMLPLGTSAVTLGLGFVLAFGQPPLNWRASPLLLPVAHSLVAFPFVVRSLLPALRRIEPQLREVAATLGAGPLAVWRHVDLPIMARAMTVAAAFAFSISLGEFGATALLARPDLPTAPLAIFRYLGQPGAANYGQALALSTLLAGVIGLAVLLIEGLRVGDLGEF